MASNQQTNMQLGQSPSVIWVANKMGLRWSPVFPDSISKVHYASMLPTYTYTIDGTYRLGK